MVDLFSIIFYVLFICAAKYIKKPSGTFANREVLKIVPFGIYQELPKFIFIQLTVLFICVKDHKISKALS